MFVAGDIGLIARMNCWWLKFKKHVSPVQDKAGTAA